MTINPAAATPAARSPRAIVRIGGTPVDGWIEWEATNSTFFEADTFSVSFAVSRLPAAFNLNWFSQQTEIFLEILAGFPSNPSAPTASELTSLIYGRIDDIELDATETILRLTGRDLTGAFIDTPSTTQYSNRTASQIVQQICANHGIAVNITTTDAIEGSPAESLVGVYSLRSTTHMPLGSTEWDVISSLARESGFVACMFGQVLYWGPDPTIGADPYQITYIPPTSSGGPPVSNVKALSFSRSMTVAKGISVTAMSASYTGPSITRSYPQTPRTISPGKASPYGPTTQYFVKLKVGKTPQQVEAAAEARYDEIIQHTMKLHAELPGDVLLSKATPMTVFGTGTAWDQIYYPKSIVRRMSMDEGFTMEVQAQHSTPALEAVLEQSGASA